MESYPFLQEYNGAFGLDISGDFSWESVLNAILNFAGDTLNDTHRGVLLILGISILGLLIHSDIQTTSNSMAQYTAWVITGVCAYPIVSDFIKMVAVAKEGVSNITALMLSSVPAMVSLPISTGAGVFLLITQITGALMLSFFLPLLLCQTGLGVCDTITERFSLRSIRQMLKNVFAWGLGVVMLIFSITSSICGVLAGAGGTVVGRSLRYASSMIPVVGKYLSESAEMIYAGSASIKGTLGVGICIAVIGCMLAPFLRIMIYVFVYKFVSFCIKPFGLPSVVKLTDAVAEGLGGLAGITILTAAIGLINVSVMIRSVGMSI